MPIYFLNCNKYFYLLQEICREIFLSIDMIFI
ncbi:MAG: hypothetical protein Q607_CBUC00059G0006 [Clostridium butyricum DORA_1]|jgi:hypothetical protein|nr:MAG: hypothetical protein Q607_CBUC00059G0006 [Clostridium butyricum DORA_1]